MDSARRSGLRGRHLGRRLVEECVEVARAAGYRRVVLWTNDPLTSAARIYRAVGFRLTAQEAHHSFGVDLIGQTSATISDAGSPRRLAGDDVGGGTRALAVLTGSGQSRGGCLRMAKGNAIPRRIARQSARWVAQGPTRVGPPQQFCRFPESNAG